MALGVGQRNHTLSDTQTKLEAIATRSKAIAIRLEAIALRLEAIAVCNPKEDCFLFRFNLMSLEAIK